MEENLPNTNQNINPPPQEVPAVNPSPTEDQTTPKRKPSAVKIIMFIIILLLLAALGYLKYQNNQLKDQIAYKPTPTPTPSLEPASTPDPITNWVVYTNPIHNYQMKYPPIWENITDPKSNHNEFSIKSPEGELIHATFFKGVPESIQDNQNQGINKTFVSNEYYIYITYVACDGPRCGNGEKDMPTYNNILSTFKFTEGEFVCPETKEIDCSPCEGGPCPLMFPAHCSKGSAQYNWIVENCPDVTFTGLE